MGREVTPLQELSGPTDGFFRRKLFVSRVFPREYRAVYGNPLDAVNLRDREEIPPRLEVPRPRFQASAAAEWFPCLERFSGNHNGFGATARPSC